MQEKIDFIQNLNKDFREKVIYTCLLPIDKINVLGGYEYEIVGGEYIEKNEI